MGAGGDGAGMSGQDGPRRADRLATAGLVVGPAVMVVAMFAHAAVLYWLGAALALGLVAAAVAARRDS